MLKAITVARNEEELVSKCVKRVLRQRYPVHSYLIIDDYSSDKTVEIIQGLNDGRIKLLRAEDLGCDTHDRQRAKRIQSLRQLAMDMSGDWDYLLVVDADTEIPIDYCETIINAMEKDKKLILAGAKYLRTPTQLEVSAGTHVRGSNNIIKRSFYNLFRERGFDYNNPYGEVVLERYAKALGYEVKAFPSLIAVQGRETTTPSQSLAGGIHEYIISTPLLLIIISLLRNRSPNDLLLLYGWLWAKTHRIRKYFSRTEDRSIATWYIKRWLTREDKI